MNKHHIGYSACLAMLIVCSGIIFAVSGTSGPYWTKSYHLSAGLGAMHEIQVVNGAELVLHSPPGSNFDLYAMNNPGPFGTCPSNSYIMSNAGKTTAGMGFDNIILEPGLWCLVVYAESGSGTYLLEASTLEAGTSGGWPGDPGGVEEVPGSGWWGPSGPGTDGGWLNGTSGTEGGPFHGSICVPYRSVTNPGIIDAWSDEFLYDREGVYGSGGTFFPNADTYSFQVQGYRSDIELIVIGSCGADIPNRILTEAEVTDFRRTPTFNGSCRASYGLLVSKDCDPNYPDCPAIAHVNSTGNAYYRIENPSSGSTYFVSIAGYGSSLEDFDYQLLVRSYQC